MTDTPTPYQVCTRCVMDSSFAEIEFDAQGVCNCCHGYDQVAAAQPPPAVARQILERTIQAMKEAGRGRDYDCVLGLSGGVDSSFLAWKLREWGLRPLAVQFDNGWNTELAVKNVENICRKLNIDLFTYVVDWNEFRDLQLAFLKAGVANVEAPSDHGIFACIYQTALQKNIRYLVSGVNYVTETFNPLGVCANNLYRSGYMYSDLVHLQALHRRFGTVPLKTFPRMGFFRKLWLEQTHRILRFDPLNFISYNKAEAIALLQRELGWRPYEGKHGESVITRFHQAYILPTKFKFDKRRLHLSGLIWSGQLSCADALRELEKPPMPPALLRQDKEFVVKKFNIKESEFDAIMAAPPHSYDEYPNINWLFQSWSKYAKHLRPFRSIFARVR